MLSCIKVLKRRVSDLCTCCTKRAAIRYCSFWVGSWLGRRKLASAGERHSYKKLWYRQAVGDVDVRRRRERNTCG